MENKFKLVGLEPPNVKKPVIDWSICILCQKDTNEKLKCPAKGKHLNVCGYKTLVKNLLSFQELNSLPENINLSDLDEGNGLEETLKVKSASWHDSCRVKYNKTELLRVKKRLEKN